MDDTNQSEGKAPSQQNQGDQQKPDPSDQLTPEHPRFKEVVAEKNQLKEEVEGLKSQVTELKESMKNRLQDSNESIDRDEQAALDKIDREFKKRGYVTEEQLAERERITNRAATLSNLTKEYDGSNGYPKFVAEDVAAYAKKNGFGDNFKAAYREMHFDAIVQVNARRGTTDVPGSEPPSGGARSAPNLGLTADQIATMSDAEYEKQRDKILSAIRPK